MTPRQKLEVLLRALPQEMLEAFLIAIQEIVDNVAIGELTAAVEEGNVEKIVAILNITDPAFRPLVKSLEKTYESFGEWKVGTFPGRLQGDAGTFKFRFDMRNPRAENWLRQQSSALVTAITEETRANVRSTLTSGMEAGRNPRSVALDIVGRQDAQGNRVGGIVGLTRNQEYWTRSFRAKLEALDSGVFEMSLRDARFDGTVHKAIESGKPLTTETIDKLVDRYRARALKYRGEMIGRTEALHSLNQADYEATKQAVESGAIRAQAVQREWDSAGDGRVRPAHRMMDGQRVGIDEAFTAPDGAKLMFPGDTSLGAPAGDVVGCRCRVRTIVDWLDRLRP